MSWMQDNRAGTLHSRLVLALINSGALQVFHELSCSTDPTPTAHVSLTWLHADLVWASLLFLLPAVECQFSSECLGSNLAS